MIYVASMNQDRSEALTDNTGVDFLGHWCTFSWKCDKEF